METYFYKGLHHKGNLQQAASHKSDDWEELVENYKDSVRQVDVRSMEMPLPMVTILESLETLPSKMALYVYHKRIPVFLLQELKDRKFDFRIKTIQDNEVHLLIFKPGQ